MLSLYLNKCTGFIAVLAATCLPWTSAVCAATTAKYGMVASQEPLASQVAIDILAKGGNAIDAAVALGYALAVTHPEAGGIGGGGFMLIHRRNKKSFALNYRETAPSDASAGLFLDQSGQYDKDKALRSALSSGIPGTVMGLNAVHKRFGQLPLKQLIQPAIDLAEHGFLVSKDLAKRFERFKLKLSRYPASKQLFFKANGLTYQASERFKQKDLAKTLRLIAKFGDDAFYKGELSKRIVTENRRFGGIFQQKDFSNYQVDWLDPIKTSFRDYTVVTMPPPSAGGIGLIQLLHVLEPLPLQSWQPNSVPHIHTIAQTLNFIFADRFGYIGDPNFVNIPSTMLLSRQYASKIRDNIRPNMHLPPNEIQSLKPVPIESSNTTHFSIADSDGNYVSNTVTLNSPFGNGQIISGTGILMNNEMDDFTGQLGKANQYGLVGSKANRIAPGKRPVSSMTPTIAYKPDYSHVVVTGTPGGSQIVSMVSLMLLNRLVYDLPLQQAVSLPRFHSQWQPDNLFLEEGFTPETITQLKKMGYKIRMINRRGSVQTVERVNDELRGVSDPRRDNGTVGLNSPPSSQEKS